MNADGSGVRLLQGAVTNVHNARWSPDGRMLIGTGNDGALYLTNVSGPVSSTTWKVDDGGRRVSSFSPDWSGTATCASAT